MDCRWRCGWSAYSDVDRGRERVRRGVDSIAELVRHLSVRVAHRIQEQELPGGAAEGALAKRARDEGAGGLAVAHREGGRACHRARAEGLGDTLGLVTSLVVALVGGGRIGTERNPDASCAGAQARLLERGVQRPSAGVNAVVGEQEVRAGRRGTRPLLAAPAWGPAGR